MPVIDEKNIPLQMKTKVAWNYLPTAWWLLKNKGFKHFYNFLYTKALVPTGEGAGGAFRFLQVPLYRRFPELSGLPKELEIEQDNYCPCRCRECELSYWNEKPVYYDFESFKYLVDQLPLKWANMSAIGDPFLNPDYFKNLAYLKSKGVFINVVTDFRLIDTDMSKRLLDLGIDEFFISLDGATAKIYNIARQNINFDKVIENIRNFISLKRKFKSQVPELCFRYIVSRYNYFELPDFVDLVSSFGDRKILGAGSRVEFASILTFPEIEDMYLEKIPRDILEETYRRAKEKDVYVVVSHLEKSMFPPIETCINWVEPFVFASGHVVPCCLTLMSNKRDFLRKYSFGNAKKTPFRKIWYSDYYKWFRKSVVQGKEVPAFCAGCRMYDTTEREGKYGIDWRTGFVE